MATLKTIAEWAETLGISRQQGYAAVKRCEIPVNGGKVDLEYATILYHRHTRQRANAARQADRKSDVQFSLGGEGDYQAARARREAAEASIAEMKEAEMRGKYLLKTEVDSAIFEIARALRDGLTNCSKRLAGDVASLLTSEECEDVIEREHRALLESMSHSLKSKLNVIDDGDDE
ncbi:hypothetical protein KDM87_06870 [Undibacterium sp. FT147W]|uniref:Terminase small subunit n=1 Tax=Undibacterium rivi TaxID=2828729 RepID=A0ABS5H122_9BURK|nr:hypothetical protein [Undibacterium rivi]MBR7792318.1 hypothetical protein [Undibacterium rivi]